MPKPIAGLHHVTAIASDPQRNLDFYTEMLGLRLVKRTVNFDDPHTYHFYFGDDTGTPGTILTFFPWAGAARGNLGSGETSATAFRVPVSSFSYWQDRLTAAHIPAEEIAPRFGDRVLRFSDPDGMCLELVGVQTTGQITAPRTSDVPPEHAIRGFDGVTLNVRFAEKTTSVLEAMGLHKAGEDGDRVRFSAEGAGPGNHVDLLIDPNVGYGRLGAGSVHHIAFRAADDAEQLDWRKTVAEMGLNATTVRDRTYFHSIYFREPSGVLFEIATDSPGFTFDEPAETLGESLKLPEWLEEDRPVIERALAPIQLAHLKAGLTQ